MVAPHQHDAEHAQIHSWITRVRQPGQHIRGTQGNQTHNRCPGYEHGEGHLEAMTPAMASDAHPGDHWCGHEEGHPDLLQGGGDQAGHRHVDQHASHHGQHHLAEVEPKASGRLYTGRNPRRPSSGCRECGENE